MHIVIVHRGMFPERIGGTYSYIYELGRRLAARGHRVDVIASTRRSGGDSCAEFEGMTVYSYAFRRWHPVYSTLQHLSNTARLFRRIHESDPVDVLSIHESQLGYRLARSRLGRRVCQVPTFHAPVFLEFRLNTAWKISTEPSAVRRFALKATEPILEHWQRRFERGVLESAAGVVVLSRYSRSHIEREFPSVDASKVCVIPGGVDTGRFRPAEDRGAVRGRLGIEPGVVHLLTVRNLAPRMGLENLVKAMPSVVAGATARGVRVMLTICGGGPLGDILRDLARDLGVGDSVRLAGRVTDDELTQYYQSADLFVLPTEAMEGFGISTVEALSTNVPVVGTPAGATPEILESIDGCLVTRDTSSGAIAESINEWLGRWEGDEVTGRYRDTALSEYDWEGVTDRLEDYYRRQASAFAGRKAGNLRPDARHGESDGERGGR